VMGANNGRLRLPGEGNKKIIKRTRKWQEKVPGTITQGRGRPMVSPGFPSMRNQLSKHWPDILAFAAVGFAWLGIIVYTL